MVDERTTKTIISDKRLYFLSLTSTRVPLLTLMQAMHRLLIYSENFDNKFVPESAGIEFFS